MKKFLSIILMLTLALSLTVTSLAARKTATIDLDGGHALTLEFSDLISVSSTTVNGVAVPVYTISVKTDISRNLTEEDASVMTDVALQSIILENGDYYDDPEGYSYYWECDEPNNGFSEPGIYTITYVVAYWEGRDTEYIYDYESSPLAAIFVVEGDSSIPVIPSTPTFTDVPNWCAEAAAYMAEHKLMNGTGENRFSPNETTTRGMLMTILARADGEDTAGDPWYKAGMEWCVGAKISDGTKPEATVTRQEIATMLWRYFDEPACDETPDFPDASSVDSWAVTAVNWCVYNDIITGKDGSLDPTGLATRAEAATMVYRAITQAAA